MFDKKPILSVILLITVFVLVILFHPGAGKASFSEYVSMTVNSGQVTGTLSDFPMLVSGTYDGTSGTPDLRTAVLTIPCFLQIRLILL